MEHYKLLAGKNVFITGASSGLGKELARQFANKGCNIFLTARNRTILEGLQKELKICGVDVFYKTADLANYEEIYELVDYAKHKMKNIDILINCAGVFPVGEFIHSTVADYNHCFNINVLAPFVLMKGFCVDMKNNNWGRIINIGSSSAYAGSPKTSIYCASKHALLGLSRSLYKELKGSNVRVFCVSPGSIQTPMGKRVEELGQLYNTFMRPQEVAEYIIHAIAYNTQMISEEIRLNRMETQ